MHLLVANAAALTVAVIYYVWRAYGQSLHRRMLRERVAYMLWVMAERVDQSKELVAAE